jgi:acetyl-CoA carboxylase, biotin carboxylase subunit
MEKYLDEPRHIEVQVLAGPRGRTIHLGERECSLQRRYQKILEETPSPALDPKERNRLLSLALKVVQATRYENAGTVEFVLSNEGKFYYLETNKRIQVEHLISEIVTGVDIVEKQLVIASEHRLELSQNEITFAGAALNCRINAEDPAHGFSPDPGRVTKFVPPGGPGIRIDSALYDAVERMKVALDETVIEGVKTTILVHQAILEDRKFLQGNYHTQFLDEMLSGWKPQTTISPEESATISLAIKLTTSRAEPAQGQARTPRSGWRSGLQEPQTPKLALYVEGI